jgi:hypothetical protein
MKSAILLISYLLTNYIVFAGHWFIACVLDPVSKKFSGPGGRLSDPGPVMFQAYRRIFHPDNLFLLFIEFALLAVFYLFIFSRRNRIPMRWVLAVAVLLALVSLYVVPVLMAIGLWIEMA